MKKIIIAAFVIFVSQSVTAQSTIPADAKTMSVAEAKQLQGNAEPTINGIPYSQYKAQVEAQEMAKKDNEKKQIANMAPLKAQIAKQAAQAKANKGKTSTLDAYNKKHKEEMLKQKADLKAQKVTKTAATQ